MSRATRIVVVLACTAIISGCAQSAQSSSTGGISDGPYRHRLLGQLDLPQAAFPDWEVVDTPRPPSPWAAIATATNFTPKECAPDQEIPRAAAAAAFGGNRWTGAHGTGPQRTHFDVSIYSGVPNPLSDIARYVDTCGNTTYRSGNLDVSLTLSSLTPPTRGSFEELSGFQAESVATRGGTATSHATMIGRANSLTMVVTYSNSGDLDYGKAVEIWKLATAKFDRTG